MGLNNGYINWISLLLVPLFVAHATEYKVVLKLYRSSAGSTPNVVWAPPRGLPAQDVTLACTKGEPLNQDPYCSFAHSEANITWTRILVISKPESKEEVFCASTFRKDDQRVEGGVQLVTFVHNHSVCFSPGSDGFDMVRLRSLESDLRGGVRYRLVPHVDGRLFRVEDVKRVKFEGVTPEMCSKYFSVHTEEDIEEARVEGDFVHFPEGYIFGKCYDEST